MFHRWGPPRLRNKIQKEAARDSLLRAMTREVDPVGEHQSLYGEDQGQIFSVFKITDALPDAKDCGRVQDLMRMEGISTPLLPMGLFSWEDVISFLYEITSCSEQDRSKVLNLEPGEIAKVKCVGLGREQKLVFKREV